MAAGSGLHVILSEAKNLLWVSAGKSGALSPAVACAPPWPKSALLLRPLRLWRLETYVLEINFMPFVLKCRNNVIAASGLNLYPGTRAVANRGGE
jgi:hypothetical protein